MGPILLGAGNSLVFSFLLTKHLFSISGRQRSWWNLFLRKSRRTYLRRKQRKSKHLWRQQEELWFLSKWIGFAVSGLKQSQGQSSALCHPHVAFTAP